MKKLKQGFTLVELIVVMCLMGIIMAIVMSVVSPASKVAAKTEHNYDLEEIALDLTRTMKATLPYATNVQIIAANDGEGIPTPAAGYGKYTNVYTIDNTAVRSTSKKGARGEVRVGVWNESSNTITNEEPVINEYLSSEVDIQMTIKEFNSDRGTGVDVGNAYIIFDVEGYRMEPAGDIYVPDLEHKYNYSDCFEFCNINNWNNLVLGGNSSATGFRVYIDQESLLTKHDKIYIFFTPAADTPIVTGKGTLAPNPGGSGGGGAGGPAGGGTSTPLPEFTVTYVYSDGTSTTRQVTQGGRAPVLPDTNIKPEYTVVTPTSRWVFDGWFDLAGNKLTSSGPSVTNNVTYYAKYSEVQRIEVKYYSYDGTTLWKTQIIDKGDVAPDVDKPVAPVGFTFDRWVPLTSSDKAFGQALTAPTSYKATQRDASNMTTIIVVYDNDLKADARVDYVNKVSQGGSPVTNDQIKNAFGTRAAGETITFMVEDGGAFNIALTVQDNIYNSTTKNISLQNSDLNHTTREYHLGFDRNGDLQLSETFSAPAETKVTFVFVDDNCVASMNAKGKNAGVIKPQGQGTQSVILNGNTTQLYAGDCVGTKQLTIYTDITFNNVLNIACDGNDKTYYVYKQAGNVQYSTVRPDRKTKVTVHFEEDADGIYFKWLDDGYYVLETSSTKSNVAKNEGSVLYGGPNICKAGTTHWVEVHAKCQVADTSRANPVDIDLTKAEVELWFYGGKLNKTAPSGSGGSSSSGVDVQVTGPAPSDASGENGKYKCLTYTLTVTNNSDDPLTSFDYKINLPAALGNIGGFECSISGNPHSSKGTDSGNMGNFFSASQSGNVLTFKLNNAYDWGEFHLEKGDKVTFTFKLYNYWPGFDSAATSVELTVS